MGLFEEVTKQNNSPVRCPIYRVQHVLSEDDYSDLLRLLDDPTISAAAISRAVRSRGAVASTISIQAHRRSTCTCPR